MSEPKSGKPPGTPREASKVAAKARREARLADALRANLKRRKASGDKGAAADATGKKSP